MNEDQEWLHKPLYASKVKESTKPFNPEKSFLEAFNRTFDANLESVSFIWNVGWDEPSGKAG